MKIYSEDGRNDESKKTIETKGLYENCLVSEVCSVKTFIKNDIISLRIMTYSGGIVWVDLSPAIIDGKNHTINWIQSDEKEEDSTRKIKKSIPQIN